MGISVLALYVLCSLAQGQKFPRTGQHSDHFTGGPRPEGHGTGPGDSIVRSPKGTLQLPAPPGSPIIISIQARTQHADSLLVIQSSGLKVGDGLSADNLAQAIRRIFATGLFTRVSADTSMIADGVQLVFLVTESPRLKSVHFLGNHKVSTKDLNTKLGAKEGEVLTDKTLFDWTRKVSDLYKEKGFVLATVTPQQMPPDPQGRVELTYQIDEGDQVKVRKVTFVGNQALSSSALGRKIVNKPYVFPWRSGKFKDEEFNKDLERISDFYRKRATSTRR